MKRFLTIFLWVLVLILPVSALAAPSITGVSGALVNGQDITISGSEFGTKSQAKPQIWADFEGSLQPTSKGLLTSWTVEHAQLTTSNVHSGSQSGVNDSTWLSAGLFFTRKIDEMGPGTVLYVNVWERASVKLYNDGSSNWKYPIRVWNDSYNGDFYVLPVFYNVEPCSSTPKYFGDENDMLGPTWENIEIIIKQSSTAGATDGSLIVNRTRDTDLVNVATYTTGVATQCSGYAANNNLVFEVDPSNWGSWSGTVQIDNAYVDTSFSRVMICSGSTWANRGHCEIQIPSSWSTSSITASVNRGSFGASDNAYLYVVDSTNAASSALSVTFGSGESDTTPPTVTAFTIPATSDSLTVPISTFTATDAVGVTGYCVNESATTPSSSSCSGSGWVASAPSSFIFSTEGSKTLYAWAKDAAGNVSTSSNDSVTITLPPPVPSKLSGGSISGGSIR